MRGGKGKDGGRRTEVGGSRHKASRTPFSSFLRPPSSVLRPSADVLAFFPPPGIIDCRMANSGADHGMISFLCSHCGAQLRVRPESAGAKGKCPRCGKSIEAPEEAGEQPAGRPAKPGSGARPTFETAGR